MILTINGDNKEFKSPLTVAELIEELNLESQLVLVERNLEIIGQDDMATTQVTEGDSIEILKMVGGGS